MQRRPRLILPEVPLHLIQRGNSRQIRFVTDERHRFYLEWLAQYADEAGCRIHAYVLMGNHVHLLVMPDSVEGVAFLMKRRRQRYVQYFNRTWKRSGTLWEGRFRSCLAQDEACVLAGCCYIEFNPVRAGMVEHPNECRWSSYAASAHGAALDRLTPNADHLGLGRDTATRRRAYKGKSRQCYSDVRHEGGRVARGRRTRRNRADFCDRAGRSETKYVVCPLA